MKQLLFLPAVLASAVPAVAQEQPILWDKVRSGMTIEEVHQLYPAQGDTVKWHGTKQTEIEDIEVLKGCKAEVEIQHESGTVDAVKVKGRGSIAGRCSDKVLAALAAKYGQPMEERKSQSSILEREGTISIWAKQGVTMRFKRFTNGAFGGGGLGAASWELTYTASASEISL